MGKGGGGATKKNTHKVFKPKYQQSQETCSHTKLAVQVDTVAANLQNKQAQETFYWRRPFLVTIFLGLHFPTMAVSFFCDQSQKLSPPAPRVPRTWSPRVAPKLYPSLGPMAYMGPSGVTEGFW